MKVWQVKDGRVISVIAEIMAENYKDEGPIYMARQYNSLDNKERRIWFCMDEESSGGGVSGVLYFPTEAAAWDWFENQADFMNIVRGLHLEMDLATVKAGREKMDEEVCKLIEEAKEENGDALND